MLFPYMPWGVRGRLQLTLRGTVGAWVLLAVPPTVLECAGPAPTSGPLPRPLMYSGPFTSACVCAHSVLSDPL